MSRPQKGDVFILKSQGMYILVVHHGHRMYTCRQEAFTTIPWGFQGDLWGNPYLGNLISRIECQRRFGNDGPDKSPDEEGRRWGCFSRGSGFGGPQRTDYLFPRSGPRVSHPSCYAHLQRYHFRPGLPDQALGHLSFHARGHQGALRTQQRHCLSLHIAAHQSPISVIMLKKRDEAGSYTE